MEQSTTQKVTNRAATREPRNILWNLKLHYHIHKSSPLIPILRQTNLVPPPPPKSYLKDPS
jgi:hypothetical protein